MAKNPSAILVLPLDPTTSAEALRPAVEAGTKIVLLSNVPTDYEHGKDYVAIVTDDLFQMGKQAADALAAAMGKKGKVAWIFHDAQYYVTNQRDNAFKTTIQNDYPDIEIVAEQGLADPARAEEIANALLTEEPRPRRHLRHLGRARRRRARGAARRREHPHEDRHARPLRAGRARHGAGRQRRGASSPTRPTSSAAPWRRSAAYGLLGKEAPPFIVAPAITVTKANVAAGLAAVAPPRRAAERARREQVTSQANRGSIAARQAQQAGGPRSGGLQ